jgi:elongation factor G
MHSNKQNPKDFIEAGDICAAVGFKDIRTGDTLCDISHPIVLESMDFPEPVIGIAVEPKSQKDIDKLSQGLSKLAEEDPTFRVNTDPDSGQTVIRGMGELHLEILVDACEVSLRLNVTRGRPRLLIRRQSARLLNCVKYSRNKQVAVVNLQISALSLNLQMTELTGLQFIDEVKGGRIPKEYIPSVKKDLKNLCQMVRWPVIRSTV